MTTAEQHYCDHCGEEAWVAVGEEKVWLCFTHFNDYLAEKRDLLRSLIK